MKNTSVAGWLLIFLPFYLIIPIAIGFGANPSSPLTWVGLCLAILGWFFLVRAKWANFKKLEFMSFGLKGLPPKEARFYKIAYILIACGMGLIVYVS